MCSVVFVSAPQEGDGDTAPREWWARGPASYDHGCPRSVARCPIKGLVTVPSSPLLSTLPSSTTQASTRLTATERANHTL